MIDFPELEKATNTRDPFDLGPVDLGRINLKLLRVFDAIVREGSVTGAGERLGLTQSAISHSLRQLRAFFGDELFVRAAGGMVPTPLARRLGERLPLALLQLEQALSSERFDPGSSTATFSIACSDYTAATYIPVLHRALRTAAPGIRLRIVPAAANLVEQLDRGRLDLIIAGLTRAPERFGVEPLFVERTVLVMRQGHPLAGSPIGPAERASLQLVRVDYNLDAAPDGDEHYVRWGGLTQWSRTTGSASESPTGEEDHSWAVTVPNFLSAVVMASACDLAAEVPERLAHLLAPRFGLVIRGDLPSDSAGTLVQIWHRTLGASPGLNWLRELVRVVARDFAEKIPTSLP